MIIADREMDRNFRYARQERLSRKTVRPFSTEQPYPRDEFLPAIKRGVGSGLPVSIDQGILWGKWPEEHRPCGVLQALPCGVPGEHHQRPQTTSGTPSWNAYVNGTVCVDYQEI